MFQILFLGICYTVSFYSSTLLTDYCSPFLMMGARFIFSGFILVATQYLFEKKELHINTNYTVHYVVAITMGFVVPFVIGATVLGRLPAVDTSTVAATSPIIVYILSALFFGSKANKKQLFFLILGTIFSFAAVIIEAGVDRVSLVSWQEPTMLLVSLVYGLGWLAIGRLVEMEESEVVIVGIGFFATGSISLLASFLFENPWFNIKGISILLFLAMAIFGDLIVTRKRVELSEKYSQTMLSLISIFSPFIIALHETIFSGKHFSAKFFLIIIPALICFAAFYKEESNPENALS